MVYVIIQHDDEIRGLRNPVVYLLIAPAGEVMDFRKTELIEFPYNTSQAVATNDQHRHYFTFPCGLCFFIRF